MEQELQLIESYLAGTMSAEQRQAFEARMESDADFAELFKRERSMQAFLVKENNKERLLPQLENLGKKHFAEEAAPQAKVVGINRSHIWRGLAVAATVTLLVVALRFFLFQPSLYEQYAAHTPISLVEKSENIPTAAAAEAAFNRADYASAYDLLSQYLQAAPDDTKALLAQGISALELQRYEESANIFNQIHTGTSALKYTGTWYLALLNIKQGQLEDAVGYLEQIPDSEGVLYVKATELLEKVRN